MTMRYEALVGHPDALKFLKIGVTFEKLDVIVRTMSDNACATAM